MIVRVIVSDHRWRVETETAMVLTWWHFSERGLRRALMQALVACGLCPKGRMTPAWRDWIDDKIALSRQHGYIVLVGAQWDRRS